jgi:hypothetical protein
MRTANPRRVRIHADLVRSQITSRDRMLCGRPIRDGRNERVADWVLASSARCASQSDALIFAIEKIFAAKANDAWRKKKATLAGQGPAWPRSAPAEAGLIVKVSSQPLWLQ